MATILNETSKTFSELLLVPGLTKKEHIPSNVSLNTPIVKFKKNENPTLSLNLPFVSAVMQAVSGVDMAVALAKSGGVSFIYHSQSIEDQVKMIRKVKYHRAGFVISDSNIHLNGTLHEAMSIAKKTGHHNIPVTDNGRADGVLLGMLSKKNIPFEDIDGDVLIKSLMTPVNELIVGSNNITLDEARVLIWENKLDCLPIVDTNGKLVSLAFRRDFMDLKECPNEVLDVDKRLIVGAGINTHDYKERLPKLIEAGADIFVIDSSDGHSEYQRDLLSFARDKFGGSVKIGAGNVVDAQGFRYLAESGADFIKVGIGGGSICITREQKGIGRGSVNALMDVVSERDKYFEETNTYIPICMDGGISLDYQIAVALALGADFIMMGRYFARFDESPGRSVKVGTKHVKEYWAEGSNRAANWTRYDMGDGNRLKFEEGVDGFVPYAGDLNSNVEISKAKITSTMCNCGALNLTDFRSTARLIVVSGQSISDNTYQIERRHNEELTYD